MTPRRFLLALTLPLAASVSPSLALAQQAPGARDVQLTMLGSPWFDVGYIALGGASLAVGSLALSPPNVHVAPLDGAGHRDNNPTVGTITDTVWVSGLVLSIGAGALTEYYGSGSRGWQVVRAPLVLSESLLMATGVVALMKNIIGECRPRAWDDATQRCVGTDPGHPVREDRVSFPSGHTAPMAALAGASLGLWVLPSHARTEYIPLFLGTSALALTNMVLRVVAGAHDWVDTTVGLALGFGIGFGTAALHTRTTAPTTGVTGVTMTSSPLSLGLSGRF